MTLSFLNSVLQENGEMNMMTTDKSQNGIQNKRRGLRSSLLGNKFLIIGVASGLILVTGGMIWSQSEKNAQPAPVLSVASTSTPLRVTTEIARKQGVDILRVFTGSIEPLENVTLTSRVMGQITQLTVQEGDRVKAGDSLVEIDVADIRAQSNQALAGVTMAQSNYQNSDARLQQSLGQLVEVEAELAEAQLGQRRMKILQSEGAVSQQLLDQANTRVQMLQARFEQIKAGISQSQAMMKEAQAQVSQAQAQVVQVSASLNYGTITAPFDAIVTRKHTEVGALAGPGQSLVTLESSDRLRFSTQVPEAMIAQIRQGQKVSVYIDALNREVSGTVSHIIPAADPTTRNFMVKVTLNGTAGLISGMFGRLKLTNPTVATNSTVAKAGDRRALMISQTALVKQFGVTGVFKVVAGQTNFQPITTGRVTGDAIEVFSGLADGDRIILQPPTDLKNGTAVQVN
jgi:RND family efflux transporter MFP subunit